MTAADLQADLQRRMNMTVRLGTLMEVLDSIHVLQPDSVVAYSTQRFVRVIRLDDGTGGSGFRRSAMNGSYGDATATGRARPAK